MQTRPASPYEIDNEGQAILTPSQGLNSTNRQSS